MSRLSKKSAFTIPVIIGIILLLLVAGFFIHKAWEKRMYPIKYEEEIALYSERFDVPRPVIYAVIHTESRFNPDSTSSAGACGLMQLMPTTYTWLSEKLGEQNNPADIFNPDTNIRLGVYYLSFLKERFEDWETVYAAYNAGQGRVAEWLANPQYSEDGKTLNRIPINETSKYTKKVSKAREIYIKLYFKEQK